MENQMLHLLLLHNLIVILRSLCECGCLYLTDQGFITRFIFEDNYLMEWDQNDIYLAYSTVNLPDIITTAPNTHSPTTNIFFTIDTDNIISNNIVTNKLLNSNQPQIHTLY
eukprot:498063_1